LLQPVLEVGKKGAGSLLSSIGNSWHSKFLQWKKKT